MLLMEEELARWREKALLNEWGDQAGLTFG